MSESESWCDAIRRGDTARFRQLVAERPERLQERDESGNTPLGAAVERDLVDFVTICLEHGADPNEPTDDCGWTLMRTALESDHPDSLAIVRALIAHGAAVDGIRDRHLYRVPVFDAARFGNRDKLVALLDAGADVNGRDPEDDETALMAAARFDYPDIVRLLLERGADASLVDSCIGQTALDIALVSAKPNAGEIVDLLRKIPNASPALTAAGGRLDVARLFVEQCYSAEDMAHPLHAAAGDGELEALETLLAAGYDIDAREPQFGDTPLIAATRLAEIRAVELLLARGADRFGTDDDGQTAREIAQFHAADAPHAEDRARFAEIERLLH